MLQALIPRHRSSGHRKHQLAGGRKREAAPDAWQHITEPGTQRFVWHLRTYLTPGTPRSYLSRTNIERVVPACFSDPRHPRWGDRGDRADMATFRTRHARLSIWFAAVLLLSSLTLPSSAVEAHDRVGSRGVAESGEASPRRLPPPSTPIASARASANRVMSDDPRCQQTALNAARNGEASSGSVEIGFPIEFFGRTYEELFVNMDGNVSFTGPSPTFESDALTDVTRLPMIAPFLADVDTFDPASGLVHYGRTSYAGRRAFCVDWFSREPDGLTGVGYFDRHVDRLNVFQLLLVERATGDGNTGDFDIVFNYDSIAWDTSDEIGESGAACARVGFSDGSGVPAASFELPLSGTCGVFLDSEPSTGLAETTNRPNSEPDGRWVFSARSGGPPASVAPPPHARAAVSATVTPVHDGVAIGQRELIVAGTVKAVAPEDPMPTGEVHLVIGENDHTNGPTATLDDEGRFTLPALSLPAIPASVEPYALAVAYDGDVDFVPSVSHPIRLRVYKADVDVDLVGSVSRSTFGEAVTFEAGVAYREPHGRVPQGSVSFEVDGVSSSAMQPLDSEGRASWTTSLTIGPHAVAAQYIPTGADLTRARAHVVHRVAPPEGKIGTGLTLRPLSLRGDSLGFRFSGKLVLPSNMPRDEACSGTVTVALRQGPLRASGSARVGRGCHYDLVAAFPDAATVDPKKPVRTTTTFSGNEDVRRIKPIVGSAFVECCHPYPGGGNPQVSDPWIVTLGESYMSGEGGRWAGNSNLSPALVDALGATAYYDNLTNNPGTAPGHPVVGTHELIPGCHRSRSAEAFVGSGYKGLNLACSGALTSSYTSTGGVNTGFKPGIDFYQSSGKSGQASMLSAFASTHRVEVVVLAIGGNDFGFGDIVTTCLTDYLTSLNVSGYHYSWHMVYVGKKKTWLGQALDAKNWKLVKVQGDSFDLRKYCSNDPYLRGLLSPTRVAQVTERVKTSILNVAHALWLQGYKRRDYTIVVRTAPDPIAGSGDIRYDQGSPTWIKPRQSVGGCGIWDKDLDWIHGFVLPTLNSTFKQAASQAADTPVPGSSPPYKPRVAVLDVQDAFAGRRLCQTGVDVLPTSMAPSWSAPEAVNRSEWVTQIRTVTAADPWSPYEMQEGIHPNYWGHLALRACVRYAALQSYWDPPKSGTCKRAGTGLDLTTSPPEPKMVWQPW